MLVTVSRLDGAFGLRGLAMHGEPTSGGLAGLAKTAGHEWPEVHCKAIDLDPAFARDRPRRRGHRRRDVPTRAGRGGPVPRRPDHAGAVPGAAGGRRWRPRRSTGATWSSITGGARGITAEVAVALAEAFRPTLVLLGRSPEPAREPDWLVALARRGRDQAGAAVPGQWPCDAPGPRRAVPPARGQPRDPPQPPPDRGGRGAGRSTARSTSGTRPPSVAGSTRSAPSSAPSGA